MIFVGVKSDYKKKLESLETWELQCLEKRMAWLDHARDNQKTPSGNWKHWVTIAGRGFGKSKLGSEDMWWWGSRHDRTYLGVISPTHDDVRNVCFEGVSGILTCAPNSLIKKYNKTDLIIEFINGTIIRGFSAKEPDRLRGPQFHRLWMDEFAAFEYPDKVYQTAMFALRLGVHPQILITTTPQPIQIIKDLIASEDTLVNKGSTYDNRENLPQSFIDNIMQHEGTDIGRQEIHGEILDFEEHGIIKRSWFELWPHNEDIPTFTYIIQSYDTAFKKESANDYSAGIVVGVFLNEQRKRYEVMILDAWRDKLGYPELRDKIQSDYHTVSYGVDNKAKVDEVLIEDKGSGQSLIQDLRRALVPVRSYNPGRADKLSRAYAISHLVADGMVWIPESAKYPGQFRTWADDFINEVCVFGPGNFNKKGTHDDFLDCFTQSLAVLRDMQLLRLATDKELELQQAEEAYYEIEEKKQKKFNPYAI